MKYILPIVLSLLFGACSDSNKTASDSANSTVVEQTTAVAVESSQIKDGSVQEEAKKEISGEAVFNKCKSCHGNSGEKKALGTSQIIKGWQASQIEDALKGYQDGSYGGTMKNIMAAQAKGLSDEEIKKVAFYIQSL